MSLSAKYENSHNQRKINHSFEVNFLTVHYVFETQSKPRDECPVCCMKKSNAINRQNDTNSSR